MIRDYSRPATPAPFTPSHAPTADEKNNQNHEHGRRAQLKARFKNPCKRFFLIFFSLIHRMNQTAEALPTSKRTPTVSDHRRAPLDFPLADSTPVTRGEPFETQGDQPVIYHLSLAHRKPKQFFSGTSRRAATPTHPRRGGEEGGDAISTQSALSYREARAKHLKPHTAMRALDRHTIPHATVKVRSPRPTNLLQICSLDL